MLGFQAARPLPAALLCHVALEICLLASASFVCSSKEGVESKEWYCITKCGELIHRGNVLYGRDSMGLYVVSSYIWGPIFSGFYGTGTYHFPGHTCGDSGAGEVFPC